MGGITIGKFAAKSKFGAQDQVELSTSKLPTKAFDLQEETNELVE